MGRVYDYSTGFKYDPQNCVLLPGEIIKTTKKLSYSEMQPPYYFEVIKVINEVILCHRVLRTNGEWLRVFKESVNVKDYLMRDFVRMEI